jgi:hypothetical protein
LSKKLNRRRQSGEVSREEFIDLVNAVDECSRNMELQFKRIAQIQAELDHIRAAWSPAQRRKRSE